MTSVGVRELRQRASELLRLVEGGESIEITDRGRPVAILGPLPKDPLERLRASGDLQDSQADLSDLPQPLPSRPGSEAPSSVLARLRRDERRAEADLRRLFAELPATACRLVPLGPSVRVVSR